MHHQRDIHQPLRNPCRTPLGGSVGCKINGIISSKIYTHPEDAEIHYHVVGIRQGCLTAI